VTTSSEVTVYNLALNAVGTRDNVSSPTENSREAEVCRLWYTSVRDQILASAPWPEATDIRYLSLITSADADGDEQWAYEDPRPGYSYVYALPTDCLRPQYLTSWERFLITSYGNNRRALHSNSYQAILAYTKRLEPVALWGAELQMAIVYGLAAHICMPLSGKPSRARMLVQSANDLVLAARESAANMSDEVHDTLPEWIRARGFSDGGSRSRFAYPYGALLGLPNVN
jgi:hypothetical protein